MTGGGAVVDIFLNPHPPTVNFFCERVRVDVDEEEKENRKDAQNIPLMIASLLFSFWTLELDVMSSFSFQFPGPPFKRRVVWKFVTVRMDSKDVSFSRRSGSQSN